ncbi:PilW family protein [Chromobacterium phragmitis]|uniref:Pilus assembly protein n=1 Tax=Chromobacterium phragmitis TaxID=2202141 RepID=A0A344UNP7_9NEIS|nr:PilW family protein [Chromobacterium phragmitis]AXE36895.1 pilus assembly protein [Chromobacterium phragmitis]
MTARRQRGGSLIEVMVAIAIGLFLLSVLTMIFTSTRLTKTSQSGLAQLQDNQRTAMTLINSVAQAAGYYPTPQTQTAAAALPASGSFAAGQSVAGISGSAGASDTLSVRFASTSADAILNCNGSSNASANSQIYVNVFAINSANQLTCSVNGAAAQVLVEGVSKMTVLYGVDENNSGSTTRYYPASALPAGATVRSLWITLTLVNPLANQPGQPSTVPMSWLIGLMNQL